MSAPVDVLSVMRYLHDLANESPDFNKADRQESHAAREAVAELIEQGRAPAVAFGCYDGRAVQFVSEDRAECVEESRRDGSQVVDLIVRPAALARVGGDK